MKRLTLEFVFVLLAYAVGFHVGHYCGFVQRDLYLNQQAREGSRCDDQLPQN